MDVTPGRAPLPTLLASDTSNRNPQTKCSLVYNPGTGWSFQPVAKLFENMPFTHVTKKAEINGFCERRAKKTKSS
jgi:hypothetical protein